jgi:hypothetical protein
LHYIRHHHQFAHEGSLVSWLGQVYVFPSEDDIDGPGHGPGRNIAGILLETDLLPVNHGALLVDQLPPDFVLAG